MPTKFKPTVVDRDGNKTSFFMKSTPIAELQEALDRDQTPAKVKQKIRNELVRRQKTA